MILCIVQILLTHAALNRPSAPGELSLFAVTIASRPCRIGGQPDFLRPVTDSNPRREDIGHALALDTAGW